MTVVLKLRASGAHAAEYTKLTGDEKKAFLSFVNASDIILGESELDSFMVGFKLGARFIFDTFVNDDTPYEDFLKEESE